MLTRRDILARTGLTAAVVSGRTAFAKASQPTTPVSFEIPRNACDCHTHIFGDPAKFPFWSGRSYTPEVSLPDEMTALHHALRVDRVIIVTPSVYGTDNSATLYGMKARGNNARGVAVIDDKTPDGALEAMAKAGIRGIRLNLTTAGVNDSEVVRQRFRTAVERTRSHNWHIQMNTSLAVISGIKDLVRESPVPVVFDHFAGAEARLGLQQPGFAAMLDLLRSGKAYIKISAPYRASTQAPDYTDAAPLAKAFIAANADRVIWGTNWPHPNSATTTGRKTTDVTTMLQRDDGRLLNQLPIWAPDAATRKKILVDNPARLYGF